MPALFGLGNYFSLFRGPITILIRILGFSVLHYQIVLTNLACRFMYIQEFVQSHLRILKKFFGILFQFGCIFDKHWLKLFMLITPFACFQLCIVSLLSIHALSILTSLCPRICNVRKCSKCSKWSKLKY